MALGRALAAHPGILCLDEPLSALDDATREEMYGLLSSVRRLSPVTTLHITHSRNEADSAGGRRSAVGGGQDPAHPAAGFGPGFPLPRRDRRSPAAGGGWLRREGTRRGRSTCDLIDTSASPYTIRSFALLGRGESGWTRPFEKPRFWSRRWAGFASFEGGTSSSSWGAASSTRPTPSAAFSPTSFSSAVGRHEAGARARRAASRSRRP